MEVSLYDESAGVSSHFLALCPCMWHRYAERSRRGRSNSHNSRRCRSSPLSLAEGSCKLAHPAETDPLLMHAVLEAMVGKPANLPVQC